MQTNIDFVRSGNRRSPGALLLVATLVTVVLNLLPGAYTAIVLYPIRLFVTLIHESGHALAATAVGGEVSYLKIMPNGEGVTWGRTTELTSWVFISGGYLGAAAFGSLLLLALKRAGWKNTLKLIGAYVMAVTLLWAHNPVDNLFTLVVGVALGASFIAASMFLPAEWAGFAVAFLAVQCCLNAITDLRILLYLTTETNRENDAVFMSQQYAMPPIFWAILWSVIAIAMMYPCLKYYLKPGTVTEIKR